MERMISTMKRICSLVLCAVLLLSFCSAEEIPEAFTAKRKNTTAYFGTLSILCVFDDFSEYAGQQRMDTLWQDIKQMMGEVDATLSLSFEDSEVCRFNRLEYGQSMPVSPLTAEVFSKAREMYGTTGGLYNPTVFPLVDLWGFSARFINRKAEPMPYDRPWQDGTRPLPDPAYINGFLQLVDMDGIQLTGDPETGYTLTKNIPPVEINGVTYQAQIDLGGIAKGYVVDRAVSMMLERGYTYGYFSCGGSSLGLLKSAGNKQKESGDPSFVLGVRAPREAADDSGIYAYIPLMNKSLSSSGDYESNYMIDGQVYCHIIDPFTGYPVNVNIGGTQAGICTVTLLSGSAVEDDALTTALCLMGP